MLNEPKSPGVGTRRASLSCAHGPAALEALSWACRPACHHLPHGAPREVARRHTWSRRPRTLAEIRAFLIELGAQLQGRPLLAQTTCCMELGFEPPAACSLSVAPAHGHPSRTHRKDSEEKQHSFGAGKNDKAAPSSSGPPRCRVPSKPVPCSSAEPATLGGTGCREGGARASSPATVSSPRPGTRTARYCFPFVSDLSATERKHCLHSDLDLSQKAEKRRLTF